MTMIDRGPVGTFPAHLGIYWWDSGLNRRCAVILEEGHRYEGWIVYQTDNQDAPDGPWRPWRLATARDMEILQRDLEAEREPFR